MLLQFGIRFVLLVGPVSTETKTGVRFYCRWEPFEVFGYLLKCYTISWYSFIQILNPLAIWLKSLDWFGDVSGLKVNQSKSLIFFANSHPSAQDYLAKIVGFSIGKLTVKHLGFPLFTSRLSIKDCDPIINTIKGRLVKWKGSLLNYVWRFVLINSVIQSCHLYWSGVDAIESLISNFLRGGV